MINNNSGNRPFNNMEWNYGNTHNINNSNHQIDIMSRHYNVTANTLANAGTGTALISDNIGGNFIPDYILPQNVILREPINGIPLNGINNNNNNNNSLGDHFNHGPIKNGLDSIGSISEILGGLDIRGGSEDVGMPPFSNSITEILPSSCMNINNNNNNITNNNNNNDGPRPLMVVQESPLVKLSVLLIETYKKINERYYEERRRERVAFVGAPVPQTKPIPHNALNQFPMHAFPAPNEHLGGGNAGVEGEIVVRPGEVWLNQFVIREPLGRGSFGQVVRAEEREGGRGVAIKIIRNRRPFINQAHIEIRLLREINGRCDRIVSLLGSFMFRGHLCLLFELLSHNLYELLRHTGFRGVSLGLTRKFGIQLCEALTFLARPDVNLIHCDLKPENILLVSPRRSAIKLVDFGSSCKATERLYTYIQSRFYRAPEILLAAPDYGLPIDMWSLGCVLVELHGGEPLFPGASEADQMSRIVQVLGVPPRAFVEGGRKRFAHFEQLPNGHFSPKLTTTACATQKPLSAVLSQAFHRRRHEPDHRPEDYDRFLDLVRRMLIYQPQHRLKPHEALLHSFYGVPQPSPSGPNTNNNNNSNSLGVLNNNNTSNHLPSSASSHAFPQVPFDTTWM